MGMRDVTLHCFGERCLSMELAAFGRVIGIRRIKDQYTIPA